jgi:hypothetical protein
MGLENPLAVAWEVVPFSFVLDWWIPVGNILQAYSDARGLSFGSGYTSHRTSASVDTHYEYHGGGESHVQSSRRVWFGHDRVALNDFAIPGPYQKQNWFNMEKGLTALALFRQLKR